MTVYNIDIDKGILSLQNKLLLPESFFKNLLEEDDWSFIIKLHALIEAACGSLLLYHLDEPGLKNIISRLELSNKTIGKLAFLKELELLGDFDRRFVSSLSELRNNLVHNVQNCNTTLNDLITRMDKNALKSFALNFSPMESSLQKFAKSKLKLLDEETIKRIDTNKLIERAIKNPKVHIWTGAYNFLINVVDGEGYSDFLKFQKAEKFTSENFNE